jgi:hypothetical protein
MAKIEGELKTNEKVSNKERRFGESIDYFPVYITTDGDEPVPALFTGNQIKVAIDRAKKNMEDMPSKDEGGFLFGIFG